MHRHEMPQHEISPVDMATKMPARLPRHDSKKLERTKYSETEWSIKLALARLIDPASLTTY
jgi:hypothetical protein